MAADCEEACVDHPDCWGFWYFEVYGGTCTLFSADGVKGYGLPDVGKYARALRMTGEGGINV